MTRSDARKTGGPVEPARDLIHSIDAVVWEFSLAEHRFTFVSDASQRLLGYAAERWLQDAEFWQTVLLHPADRERVVEYCRRATQTREDYDVRYRVRRGDGRTLWIKDLVHVERDENGVAQSARGVMFEVTELKRAERARRASEMRYRRLIETSPYAIFEFDAHGTVVQANDALGVLLDVPPEQITGRNFREFVAPEDMDAANSAFSDLLSGARRWTELELHVLKAAGERRLVAATATALSQRGRITGISGIARDITDEREREDALRRAERLAGIGTLIGGVAHELNNPLQAISSFAELLVQDIRDPELCRRAELIQREAERASHIVGSLRRLARDTQTAGERTLVDVNDIVRHVVQVRSYTLHTANIELAEQLEPLLPPILASRTEIEQVVLNILVNAEQALSSTPRGTRRIAIVTRRERGSVVVSIADTGPGIAAPQLEQIFNPFFTTKSPGEGTGLGLSLAHSIVTEHGGTLRAQSTPGGGATFIMRLPDAEVTISPTENNPGLTEAAPRPLSILVVEDEGPIRDVVANFLRQRGHEVITAAEGAVALQALSARAPDAAFDVILSDLRMPGLGGDELVDRLRAIDPALVERVIVMTGDAASDEAGATLAEIGVPVLLKPFTLAELATAVESR